MSSGVPLRCLTPALTAGLISLTLAGCGTISHGTLASAYTPALVAKLEHDCAVSAAGSPSLLTDASLRRSVQGMCHCIIQKAEQKISVHQLENSFTVKGEQQSRMVAIIKQCPVPNGGGEAIPSSGVVPPPGN